MLATSLATAEIIDFEDVATPSTSSVTGLGYGAVSNGYRGFNWSTGWGGSAEVPAGSAFVYHNIGSLASGYQTAIASGTRAMFLPTDAPSHELTITRGETWNFGSMDFAAAWNTNLSVEITGLLAGNVLYTYSTTIATPGQLASLELNFYGIDTLFIRSSGGTTAYSGGAGAHLIIDNLAYSVPAPGAVALAGLAGLTGRRRR
jgi:hypothetical protein